MPRLPPTRLLASLLALALAAAALPAAAQWKWKDAQGRVQYSDLPPPSGTPDANILSRPQTRTSVAPRTTTSPLGAASAASAASAPLVAAPRTVDPELEARRKRVEAEQQAKVKAEEERVAAVRADNCKRAQAAMRSLDSGVRLTRTNEKGEREFLDDKDRADESKRVRETIASACR